MVVFKTHPKLKKKICIPVIVLFLIWQNNDIVISRYEYESDKIPEVFDGYKIVQVSDLHNKCFGKNQKRLVRQIRDIEPDAIVITGDLIDANHTNIDKAFQQT